MADSYDVHVLNQVMGPDRSAVVDWLLEGDPAIRWQVMRDLLGASKTEWMEEQQRVASEGWGARLLQHQDAEGRWTPKLYGKKWISTTYTMALLRRMGLPRDHSRAIKACLLFLDEGVGTLRRSEKCIASIVLALLYWFSVEDERRDPLIGYLLDRQLPDGGWNCNVASSHGSFHTSSSALEALRVCAEAIDDDLGEIAAAEARGREFFLEHRLFRSHRTGEVVSDRFLRLSFPPRWHFDVLRGLDYFWSARALTDDRLQDAVEMIEKKRLADGRWPLQQRYPGETWFEMEEVGGPSRWNTLRAMRVLEAWASR